MINLVFVGRMADTNVDSRDARHTTEGYTSRIVPSADPRVADQSSSRMVTQVGGRRAQNTPVYIGRICIFIMNSLRDLLLSISPSSRRESGSSGRLTQRPDKHRSFSRRRQRVVSQAYRLRRAFSGVQRTSQRGDRCGGVSRT
jgi:hypothetical protein